MRFIKRDFFYIFWAVNEKAILPKNIVSGWRKTGIHLWDPDVVLKLFSTLEIKRLLFSKSIKLILSTGDWRCIENKLKEVVTDFYNTKVKKLTENIQELYAIKVLFKNKIKGL